jgi:hypothetical protein
MLTVKRLFLAAVLVASCFSQASAQIFDQTKGKYVRKLYNQPVHVYSYGTGAYADRLKTAFETYWKVTPFQLHDISKGYPTLEEESTVFAPVVVGLVVRDHATSMNHPFYVYAEAGKSGKISGNNIVAALPINGFHYEFDITNPGNMYANSLLRIPYMVATTNDMVTYVKANENDKGYFKAVDARTAKLSSKTMLIPSELLTEYNMGPNTTALMKGKIEPGFTGGRAAMGAILEQSAITYAGKYKIMPTAEIMKLETSPDAGKYALFLPAIDQHKYIMVYDLQTRELMYFDHVTMGMKVKEKDFEKLNKAAGF